VKIKQASKSEVHSEAKNLARPGGKKALKRLFPLIVAALIIVLVASYFVYKSFRGASSNEKDKSKIKSIVVLYFNNMTGDDSLEYFCDGLTEELTDQLTKIKGLDVKSRHSALSYKNKPISTRQIASELNVDVLMEGSYRKSGNTGKITVQLINAKTDNHYWSDDFTMDVSDIFKVQSEIAIAIAKKLEADLNPETIAKINERGTDNIEAYDNFLRGSFFHYTKYFNTRLYEDFERSKKYFEAAIQLDPGYADAYAGLSDLYDSYSSEKIATDKIPNIFELKEQLARKALALNPNSAMANTAMAWAIRNRQKGHPGDSSLFFAKRAHYLAPSDPVYSHALSFIVATYGLDSLAIPICKEAIKADPLEPNHYAILGYQYAMLGKYQEAKQALHKSFELTNDKFDDEKFALFWLTYFREFKTVEEKLESRPEPKYNQAKSFLFASKGEFSKIDSVSRRDTTFMLYVDLLTDSNKVSKNVLNRLEAGVDKGSWERIYKYDFLKTAYYFNAYRNNADFNRILAKAKKVQDDNLLKYEKFDASN
jgi:TolB-like protein